MGETNDIFRDAAGDTPYPTVMQPVSNTMGGFTVEPENIDFLVRYLKFLKAQPADSLNRYEAGILSDCFSDSAKRSNPVVVERILTDPELVSFVPTTERLQRLIGDNGAETLIDSCTDEGARVFELIEAELKKRSVAPKP